MNRCSERRLTPAKNRLIRLSLPLALLLGCGPALAADWISDANGCKLWNNDAVDGETVTWTGACKDGYANGQGTVTWTAPGNAPSSYDTVLVDGKRPSYSMKESQTGTHLGRTGIHNLAVPPDKTYAEMTPDEKAIIKSAYGPMSEADEPPFPLHGEHQMLEAVHKIGSTYDAPEGTLDLVITVNSKGQAIGAKVYSSPDSQLSRDVATMLMVQPYKPAVCNGQPCQMDFPFKMVFYRDNSVSNVGSVR